MGGRKCERAEFGNGKRAWCWGQRDTRGERGYDGSLARGGAGYPRGSPNPRVAMMFR